MAQNRILDRWLVLTLLYTIVLLTLTVARAVGQTAEPVASGPSAEALEDRALTPEERGLEIAMDWDRRDSGFGDQLAALTMVLRNRHGQESTREIRTRTLEVEGDGDKSLVIFDRPRDVEGTAFLTFSHATGSDDQWLYLPALKRVKRIATNNKSGPFMGSEFSYEDISSQEVEEYTYRFLRDEALDGLQTHVVESVPVDENSGYSKLVTWHDVEHLRPLRVDFYDRKGELLKTLTYEGYRQYEDRYWRADRFRMLNHQTGKSTDLEWRDYEFGTGLTDRDFDQNTLKRVR